MMVKILFVVDPASEKLNIRDELSKYCIFTACSGAEAMRILEQHDGINLMVLDLDMPDMDGFEFMELIKRDERFSKLRIIILTDHGRVESETRCLKLGVADYISKPINMDLLKARIDVHVALLNAERALDHLNENSIILDMIFDQTPIGMAILRRINPDSPDEVVVKVNSAFEQITGRTREELINSGWKKILQPDDLEEDLKNFMRLRSGEINIYSIDKRYIKPDNSAVWVHLTVAPLTLPGGDRYGYICLLQDISKRKEIEQALKESERSKSVFLSHLPGLAYRCKYDRNWTMEYVSEGCYNLTGYPPESLLHNRDLSYSDVIAPEYRQILWEEWERILPKRLPFKYEYEIITATGERKWVLEMGQGVYNDEGEVEALEGIILDITDRKTIEDKLKYNNEHDRWTGLYNRDYLVSLLERDIKLKKKLKKALIGIDLSNIHILTVRYGFHYSQTLIKKVADALVRYCTPNCQLFHVRENRFIFYFFDYNDKRELIDFGYTIAETLESIFITERIGGCIGILEIEQEQEEVEIDLLMRRLLIASERYTSLFGRDFKVCFYDEKLEALVNRERDIVEALNAVVAGENENNELFLQYQPILDLRTGLITGFEALARLRTKKLGVVSPAEFIPVAEKTKLIIPVGEKVINKAFSFLNRLRERGYDKIGVSINISVIHLLKPGFANWLFELMRKMQVNQKNICIEITESVFASEFDRINNIIDKMRNEGLYIAIDDFGTGYSSLSREKELRVDCIKIDKYFIDKLVNADPSKVITGDIISMAHRLGHCAIAEGIEHETQLKYLIEHGCDKVQGYLISKPLDEEEVFKFLKDRDEKVKTCINMLT